MNTNIPITNPTADPNATFILNAVQSVPFVWAITAAIIVLILFLIALWKFKSDVRDEIVAHVTSDDFIQRLASLTRPSMIFDDALSILADRGGSTFVKKEGIHIERGNPFQSGSESLPIEIRVEFSRHVATQPILTALASDIVFITARRGRFHDWIFKIDYEMSGDPPPNMRRAYRLEIY